MIQLHLHFLLRFFHTSKNRKYHQSMYKKAIRNISITNCIMKTHISFSRKSLKQYYLTFPHLHRKLKLVTYLHFAPSFYITSSDRYSFCYNIWSLLSRTSTYLTKTIQKAQPYVIYTICVIITRRKPYDLFIKPWYNV